MTPPDIVQFVVDKIFDFTRAGQMRLARTAIAFGLALLAASCDRRSSTPSENEVYTLYRNSIVIPDARMHVATFDYYGDGRAAAYNMGNCQLASDLFQDQPGVKTRFWCEQGRYKP